MNVKAITEALRARKARFCTSNSRNMLAIPDPAKKRSTVLKVVKFFKETAIVDDNGNETKESKADRIFFSKLNTSNLTDADIDELYTGLKAACKNL